MSLRERAREWARPAYYLGQNVLSLAGAVLVTSSALTMIAFWFYDFFISEYSHPYVGILIFLILPGLFILGLILIPIGIWFHKRKLRSESKLPAEYPKIDLRQPMVRHGVALVAAATALNFVIVGTASYEGVNYMDSTQFCGTTCHTVMQPEYTTYLNSPHARVECVACHIGPGASWFVRSKLSGLRQVYAVTFHTYDRPIPAPVQYLRPARETCEQCHWPQRFTGDKFEVKTTYEDDEKNTPQTTVLIMKIGGRTWQGSVGIHGHHLSAGSRVQYISIDRERQVIPVVYYTDDTGKTVKFVSTDIKTTPEQLANGEHRIMDCVDCHNRPTHVFELPGDAVDEDMAAGRINPSLPYVKKEALTLLKVNYPDRGTGNREIISGLENFYQSYYPQVYQQDRAKVDQSAQAVAAIYLRNVFPKMNVGWGVHPNNIGHDNSPGCFRCHDGSHVAADGSVITNDCSACHNLLAISETNPKILSDLGMK